MSAEIVTLNDHRKMAPLFTIQVYRTPSGETYGNICAADTEWIESVPGEAAHRMRIAAGMLDAVKACMMSTADELEFDAVAK